MASFYKRGSTYTASVSIKKNNKYAKKTKSGFRTKAAAKAWATEQEQLNNTGFNIGGSRILLSSYFKNWHSLYKNDVSTSTKTWYKQVERYINLYMPDIYLEDFTRPVAQNFFNILAKKYSLETVQKVKNQLHQSIKSAIYDGLIIRDPMADIKAKGKDGKNKELKFLEEKQINDLVSYILNKPIYMRTSSDMMIYIDIFTGARYEELAALKWKDVSNNSININKAWISMDNELSETKTDSSNRIITIPENVFEELINWKKEVRANDFVFNSNKDKPITSAAANKELKYILNQINSEKIITFHGLRHTHASWLLSKGIDIQYVSERLGHKNVAMTLRVYTHLLNQHRVAEEKRSLDILGSI